MRVSYFHAFMNGTAGFLLNFVLLPPEGDRVRERRAERQRINKGLNLCVSRCIERNCRRCVLSPSGGDGVNYIPDPVADAALAPLPQYQ